MNTDKVVEMLEKVREAVTSQGPSGSCRTVDDVKKAGVDQLRAEPLLWAAYCRGWADRTADLVRTLGSSAARSPATPATTKTPRPSTHQRVPTAKATGSRRGRAATGTVTATITTPATTTKAPPPRQPTRPAATKRDITWVRPAPGRPLVPRMPPAEPHPPTTEWTGMPSRVAYVDRLPTPPPAPPSDKPGPLEPWPKAVKPTTSTRSAERAKERRREHQRQRRLRAKAEREGPSQQYRLTKATTSAGSATDPEDRELVQVSAPVPGGSAQEHRPERDTNPGEAMEVDDRILDEPGSPLPTFPDIEEGPPVFSTPLTSPRAD
ncbi:lysine-rich arabinogalactan protein 19-like [Sipha flava]|uniref:Lysine-rich arabinogalactan protein 19-like n=1 Tax=Sipha flava TaxID=143950 RepID=A0A8B8F699_9HEMI|nr:lysine-rich arabinogalactan protein 19-like [Sipha flava]